MKKQLGFWIDERDIWSGSGLRWTPSEFYQNYFVKEPCPNAMLWATGFAGSGSGWEGAQTEITWLGELAQMMAQKGQKMIVLYFVNDTGPWDNQGTVINQTTLGNFDALLSELQKYPSAVVGIQLESEYVVDSSGSVVGNSGSTTGLYSAFSNEVHKYGFKAIANYTGKSQYFDLSLGYSSFPYYNESIITSGQPSNSIGVGYGETGGSSTDLWTQTVITSIIDQSFGNPYVLIYSEIGTYKQYAGIDSLWNNPTLRSWIWDDPNYQANYQLSTNAPINLSPSPSPSPSPSGGSADLPFLVVVSGTFDTLSSYNTFSDTVKSQILSSSQVSAFKTKPSIWLVDQNGNITQIA